MSKSLQFYQQNLGKYDHTSDQISSLHDIDVSSSESQGITGLVNMGNTCYMNSVIQCLRHCTPLRTVLSTKYIEDILRKNLDQSNTTQSMLIVSFIKVIYIMWTNTHSTITPICFKTVLNKALPQFTHGQHDSHELLCALLDSFNESLSRTVTYKIRGQPTTDVDIQIIKAHQDWVSHYKNKHSPILDVFSSQIKTDLCCQNCGVTSSRYDPLMVLDLTPIQDGDIYDSLNDFFGEEQLSSDNQYLCDHCHNKSCANKSCSLWKIPDILIIKLNRFQQLPNGQFNKLNYSVNYPLSGLDMTKYVSSPSINKGNYDLCAISCHVGTMGGGHYYAMCYNQPTEQWINYDDSHISIIKDISRCVTPNTYILFYKKGAEPP